MATSRRDDASDRKPGYVVISAGFHKTHVTTAAAEASERGELKVCITGAYPTRRLRRLLRFLRLEGTGRFARLLERGERIPDDRVRSLLVAELLDELSHLLGRVPIIGRLHDWLSLLAWRLYGRLAARALADQAGARIYLFRAGFGQGSIQRAKSLGMFVLCDQALAHPQLVDELIRQRGDLRLLQPGEAPPYSSAHGSHTRAIIADIERSDAVVVNSHFVRDTFLALGWPPERVHVVYLGVDDNFLPASSPIVRRPTVGPLGLFFAGEFGRRKGAETLIEALRLIGDTDVRLQIAGLVAPEIRRDHPKFFADDRVEFLGVLRRPQLMERMLANPVFVFPSFAEGSARVVFEALACGCYVITTPNSGTIVEDGAHGSLVAPGDAERLAAAIVEADDDRPRLAKIGTRNSRIVFERYRQVHYGDALSALYARLA